MSQSRHQIDSDESNPGCESPFRHLAPVGQPESVHEVSDALYRPFSASSVKLHIAGCQFDRIPFVQAASGEYHLLTGQTVSREHAVTLGLDQLEQCEPQPQDWLSNEKREKYCADLDRLKQQHTLAEAADGRLWIIWCNHVHGTLTARTESSVVEIPFSLWGNRLKNGTDQCPPYHCPVADVDTYRLAVDDDGTISDAASIAECPETGRRLVRTRLKSCHSSGLLVEPSALIQCPIRNHWLLSRLTQVCRGCFQSVDPVAIVKGRCQSCRQLKKTSGNAPQIESEFRMATSHHGWLSRVKKVRMSLQPRHWLFQFQAHGVWWRMVIERDTGNISQVSRSSGWRRSWVAVEDSDWPDFQVQP